MPAPDDSIADTRARILAEAERLFRIHGYAKTTVGDIAGACGCSPSNVYRFFASKAEINEAICARLTTEKVRKLQAVADLPLPASERLRRLVNEAFRHTVETYLDDKKVHDMVVVALEEQWSTIQAHVDQITLIVEGLIREGVAAGEFAVADPVAAARCAHAAMAPFTHPTLVAQCMNYESRPSPEHMAEFIIAALRCGGATGPAR